MPAVSGFDSHQEERLCPYLSSLGSLRLGVLMSILYVSFRAPALQGGCACLPARFIRLLIVTKKTRGNMPRARPQYPQFAQFVPQRDRSSGADVPAITQ